MWRREVQDEWSHQQQQQQQKKPTSITTSVA